MSKLWTQGCDQTNTGCDRADTGRDRQIRGVILGTYHTSASRMHEAHLGMAGRLSFYPSFITASPITPRIAE